MTVSDTAFSRVWSNVGNPICIFGSFVGANGSLTSQSENDAYTTLARTAEGVYTFTFADALPSVSHFLGFDLTINIAAASQVVIATQVITWTLVPSTTTLVLNTFMHKYADGTVEANDLIGTAYYRIWLKDPSPAAK